MPGSRAPVPLKDFLTKNAVPFEWLDIDVDANRERFEAVNEGNGGIPLVLVGGEKLRGSNLHRLAAAVGKTSDTATAARPGEEVYGDHGVSWWQAQFTSLRGRLKAHKERLAMMRRDAQFNDELEAIKRMESAQKLIEQALNQLEIDASEVALPRRFRAD